MNKHGFTIIEMTVVVFILTTAILGMGASAGFMIRASSMAGMKSEALQAVEGRISQITMDPRYDNLQHLYGSTETGLPGIPALARVTQITHVNTQGSSGAVTDYKVVMVSDKYERRCRQTRSPRPTPSSCS